MSKYKVNFICPVHKTTYCICYCCYSELFCLENAYYCPYCDISKYVTPQYIREIVKEITNDYEIIK